MYLDATQTSVSSNRVVGGQERGVDEHRSRRKNSGTVWQSQCDRDGWRGRSDHNSSACLLDHEADPCAAWVCEVDVDYEIVTVGRECA